MLSLPEHAGVSEFLLDESEAILCEVPDIPNLSVVTAGRPLRELTLLQPDADFPAFDGHPPLKVAVCQL